jgi:hypothetical protein
LGPRPGPIDLIQNARNEGLDVQGTSTLHRRTECDLGNIIPPWAKATEAMLAPAQGPVAAGALERDISQGIPSIAPRVIIF